MSKKWVILFLILFVVLIVGGFWYLGGKTKNTETDEELAFYEALIKEDEEFQSIVADRLKNKKLYDNPPVNNNPTRFTTTDLKVGPNDLESISSYAKNIKTILTPYAEPRPNEAKVVISALKQNNPNLLQPVLKTIDIHKTAVSKLLAIEVPRDAQVIHLRLANSLANQISNLEKMANILNDPELALSIAESYPVTASNFFWATENINLYFSNHGITFPEDEKLILYFNLD